MINSQGQITDMDFSPDTSGVRNVQGSTKGETMKYVMNSPEEGKLDDCKALEIEKSKRKSKFY